jgi:type VI secretion system protein ImpG
MEDLLPYFERELLMLRRQGREFAAHYPKLAAQLHLSGDQCADPHVERLIQSSALLAARISKRLDDEYPKLTEGLLATLLPHYLQPFPACAIAQFSHRDPRRAVIGASAMPRSTRLLSPPVRGVACTFNTTQAVPAQSAQLTEARFIPLLTPPRGVIPPKGASAAISITLQFADDATLTPLNVFIDGEPSFCAALQDSLFMHTVGAYIETHDGAWTSMPDIPLKPTGFGDDEALIPFSERSHAAYRVLTEYFAFPEKFGFFDLDLVAIRAAMPKASQRCRVHLLLARLRQDDRKARLLSNLSASNLLLGCTPVVNLFRQHGEPVTINHQQTDYIVRAHPVAPENFDVHSIAAVHYRAQGNGSEVRQVRPFYTLHHGEQPATGRLFYVSRRNEELAKESPGHETTLSLVDTDFDPLQPGLATLSLELNCSNRDLPLQLPCGQADGDLRQADGTDEILVRLLRRPTPSCRFAAGRHAHWRLISHLALNHRTLSQDGLPGFREMLALYDVRQSVVSQRQIDGIVGMEQMPATMWLRHPRGATLVHGIELRLTLDEDAYIGSGVHVFIQVLNAFLALYVQVNSFVELIAISRQTGEELIRCQPKTGALPPA